MPSAVTLASLITRARDRADMTSSTFVTDARLTDYINAELSELYDLLVTAYEDYFVSTATMTLVGGTEAYNLPSNFYKLLKAFLREGAQRFLMRRFVVEDLSYSLEVADGVGSNNVNLRYRIMGGKIYFMPLPSIGGTVELFYVPEFQTLISPADVISFNVPVGWEDFVVSGAAARMLVKEESDPSFLVAEKERCKQRIMHAATDRDLGEPNRITDKSGRYSGRASSMDGR